VTTTRPGIPVWIRAALFIVLVPGAIAGWLPWYWGGYPTPRLSDPLGVAGAALAVAGWGVLLWCARDFAVRGQGTPAPYDPPRELVVAGLYRYVRNPMYVGVVGSIIGQAAVYRSMSVLWYAALVAIAFHLRVVMYEEPKLAQLFGKSFADYRTRVPRWIPRTPRDT
jgi:protein-S-isoprenylcysteine O-methyltransferase Ste14